MSVFLTLTHYFIDNTDGGLTSGWYIPNGGNTGIGNMLFQIATATCFTLKNNAKLYVPGLNTFFKLENLQKENTIFRKICSECPEEYYKVKNDREPKNPKNPHILDNDVIYKNNINLNGYFEHHSNFDKYKSFILDLFSPTNADRQIIITKYPKILDPTICSIHIRLGPDYKIIFQNTNKLYELQENYFKCLDHMIQRGIRTFFVFTNDKEYCYYILNNNPKYNGIEFIYSNERDYIDIWMISMIPNNIVSVSTLAWWGSYLNNNPNRYIIMADGHRTDLQYPEWTII